MGKTLLKFSVSWGRLSAFLSQDIEAKIELSLESKIAVSLALLGEQALEGSAHEFNNYFAAAVSAGRSEFTQAIEILYRLTCFQFYVSESCFLFDSNFMCLHWFGLYFFFSHTHHKDIYLCVCASKKGRHSGGARCP